MPSDIDEEDVRQSVAGTKKHSFGKTWKNNKGEYIRYRCYDSNVEYKIGDNVFIESQRPDQPFYICNITEFKKSKRDAFVVVVRWFYRTTEVPETVYNFLIKDRYTEHGMNAIHDPLVKSRELFISNATDQFQKSDQILLTCAPKRLSTHTTLHDDSDESDISKI